MSTENWRLALQDEILDGKKGATGLQPSRFSVRMFVNRSCCTLEKGLRVGCLLVEKGSVLSTPSRELRMIHRTAPRDHPRRRKLHAWPPSKRGIQITPKSCPPSRVQQF